MDPITIATLVVAIVNGLVAIFSAVRSNHFQSECFGCCKLDNNFESSSK